MNSRSSRSWPRQWHRCGRCRRWRGCGFDRAAGRLPSRRAQRLVVDRPIGLAGHEDHAAARLVEIGQRAAAVDDPVAVLHDAIRVGRDQRQVPRQPAVHAVVVHVGRIVVVVEVGDDNRVGDLGPADRNAKTIEQTVVLFRRSDIVDRLAAIRFEHGARHIARRHDGIVGVARHAEAVEHLDDRRRQAAGALVISTTRPPPERKLTSASQALGWAATPLCSTPQTSLRTAS